MNTKYPIQQDIDAGKLAIQHARDVRLYHARKTVKGSIQREFDISEAEQRLAKAMKPLRSWLGKSPHVQDKDELHAQLTEEVKAASLIMQKERRKLWKMSLTRGQARQRREEF